MGGRQFKRSAVKWTVVMNIVLCIAMAGIQDLRAWDCTYLASGNVNHLGWLKALSITSSIDISNRQFWRLDPCHL